MKENKVLQALTMIMVAFVLAGSLQEAFNVCAPVIAKDLQTTSSQVSMIAAVAMLTMGVAYVIYTALSDFMSIKKLLVIGILISALGSVAGMLFNQSLVMVIICRAIQMAGGTCSSALLILTATRYLDEQTRMKYYGFNTACFSGGQFVGILLGGIFATHIGWKYLFIIPALSVICIPFIMKYLPDDSKKQKMRIDIIGIMLMAMLSLFISLYFSMMNVWYLIISGAIAVIFLLYISKYKHAFITIEFFKNWKYMMVILVVVITYITQGSYSFLFAFMVSDVYGIETSKISMMLLPSYAVSMAIGIMGSRITQKIGVTKTLTLGLCSMMIGLLLGSVFLEKSMALLILMSCMFNGGFSVLYTPIMTMVINSLPENMRGVGLGFFNLCIKITSSTGIVITGKLLSLDTIRHNAFLQSASQIGIAYSNLLLIFFGVVVISVIVSNGVMRFVINKKKEGVVQ